jgi:hypothetical protein
MSATGAKQGNTAEITGIKPRCGLNQQEDYDGRYKKGEWQR